MALGAWLLLFGGQNLHPPGVPIFEDEKLSTFAPNSLPLTGFYSSTVAELARDNAEALVLGATGQPLTADLTVSQGHNHSDTFSRIYWRQLASFLFENDGAGTIGSSPDECIDALQVDQAGDTDLAIVRVWATPVEAALLTPRVRVSNSATIANATLRLTYYDLSMNPLATQTLNIDLRVLRARAWVDLPVEDLSLAPVDSVWSTRIPLIVKVSGGVDVAGAKMALHELVFGVS